MRLIGYLPHEPDAKRFGDFLYVQGIENTIDRDEQTWGVWVHSDDHLGAARTLLDEFKANPGNPKFTAAARPAEKLRESTQAEQAAYRKKMITGRQLFPGMTSHGFGIVTHVLILGAIAVFVVTNFGEQMAKASALFLSHYDAPGHPLHALLELRQGQVWRLVTPIFLHFGIGHVFFNMLLLRDLGNMLETRLGTLYFAALVIVVAAVSNLVQFMVNGPMFGGMSGVNYALIGYAWIRGRFDPAAGIFLDRQTLIWALVFFVLCFTRVFGPIANGAHAGGLLVGMLWAFIDSKRRT